MSKYNYSDFERQLNMVLAHQSAELSEIHFPSTESADACIASSEALLRKLGYKIEKPNLQVAPSNRVAVLVPNGNPFALKPSVMLAQIAIWNHFYRR